MYDQPAYPYIAYRELIVNALIHRGLDHWSAGMAVEVRLRRDRLVVSNPGGLYGITVDRLGKDAVTSARNARLVSICRHVRSHDTGARVIEALAGGIPTVTSAVKEAGLPPVHHIDAGIRFTVVLRHTPPASPPKREAWRNFTRCWACQSRTSAKPCARCAVKDWSDNSAAEANPPPTSARQTG